MLSRAEVALQAQARRVQVGVQLDASRIVVDTAVDVHVNRRACVPHGVPRGSSGGGDGVTVVTDAASEKVRIESQASSVRSAAQLTSSGGICEPRRRRLPGSHREELNMRVSRESRAKRESVLSKTPVWSIPLRSWMYKAQRQQPRARLERFLDVEAGVLGPERRL